MQLKRLSRLSSAALLLVVFLVAPPPFCRAGVQPPATPSLIAVRSDKLKTLYRREPRAKDIVARLEQALEKGSKGGYPPDLLSRRRETMESIIMAATSLSEERLGEAVDLLDEMSGPPRQLTPEALSALRERYNKLCAFLDDQLWIRDLSSVLILHDKMIKRTALGLWDNEKIESELARIEELARHAPEIPYGRSEYLRSLRDKKISPPARGCYPGCFSTDEIYLSPDRFSVSVLEESTGASMRLDTADLVIQGPDGTFFDLDKPNHPIHGIPFAPPLSLWMKARIIEGHIPAVSLRLVDESVADCYKQLDGAPLSSSLEFLQVADILSGKLDEYLERNFKIAAELKAPVLIGLFTEFDRQAAATAFGADGRTPYYLLVDPKLARLSKDKRREELSKRLPKGALAKDAGAELRKYYGDANIPDGPERVRDAWKRARDLLGKVGAGSVSLYSTAGAFHGNKKALAFPGCASAGAQDWNRLEFYWPGESILDWVGTAAVGDDPTGSAQTFSFVGAIEPFMSAVRSSNWHALPVMLRGVAPEGSHQPGKEGGWLTAVLAEILPRAYPEVKAVFLEYPGKISLWFPDAHSAVRKYIGSNQYYKPRANLAAAPGQ